MNNSHNKALYLPASKDDVLETMADAMKSDIRYAENKDYSPSRRESK